MIKKSRKEIIINSLRLRYFHLYWCCPKIPIMKVLNGSPISSFGGLNFVLKEFDQLKVGDLLSEHLPALPNQTRYEWRDLFYSFWSVIFCGGSCAEDLSENFKFSLSNIPALNVPSPDRVLNRMKQLATSSHIYDTPRGKSSHEFCHNDRLNYLNIKLLKRISGFRTSNITLDYDNTLLFTNKADANITYKKQFGYAPGVGIAGNKIVYVENRNGNSDAQTLQQDTLKRMFALLNKEGITIEKFRVDGASYQFSTLQQISESVNKFYMRTRMSSALHRAIEQIDNWKEVKIGNEVVYRGDTIFVPFTDTAKRHKQEHLLKPYRLVISKVKRADGQINVFTNEACNYHGILTNDYQLSVDQVVNFYNQRGATEKEFDILKNDFGWNRMPFSKLNQNNVFLIFTAICRNLYSHIISVFSQKFKRLKPTDRLKKFIFRFICIPAKWIRNARTWKLKVYGQVAFKT